MNIEWEYIYMAIASVVVVAWGVWMFWMSKKITDGAAQSPFLLKEDDAVFREVLRRAFDSKPGTIIHSWVDEDGKLHTEEWQREDP